MDSVGGGGIGDIHVHHTVNAIDSQSFRGMLSENSEFIVKAVMKELRNSGMKPNSL